MPATKKPNLKRLGRTASNALFRLSPGGKLHRVLLNVPNGVRFVFVDMNGKRHVVGKAAFRSVASRIKAKRLRVIEKKPAFKGTMYDKRGEPVDEEKAERRRRKLKRGQYNSRNRPKNRKRKQRISGTFRLPYGFDSSVRGRALAVHETVHCLQDLQKVKLHRFVMEMAAYLAQAMYLATKNRAPRTSGIHGAAADVARQVMQPRGRRVFYPYELDRNPELIPLLQEIVTSRLYGYEDNVIENFGGTDRTFQERTGDG